MPNIQLYNASGRDMTFEVHGFNDNRNVTVKSHTTLLIQAPGTKEQHGAIIALHDGHEGEQAEISFNGWGDMEWLDISVIVGAGGNMTVEQIGNPASRKGDPTFMQDLRSHYERADMDTKNSLHDCIHLNSQAQVERMDAPKNFPHLEAFVRTFAESKVYIGVGAWQGSKGDSGDNAQSSGTRGGNKDIRIVYSDADTPAGVHDGFANEKEVVRAVELDHRVPAIEPAKADGSANTNGSSHPVDLNTVSDAKPTDAATAPAMVVSNGGAATTDVTTAHIVNGTTQGSALALATIRSIKVASSPFTGDVDHGQPGIILSNKSSQECTYFFFNNKWNGNGTAGANFDHPDLSKTLHPHSSVFVALAQSFKGRVQRGKFIPATWVEFQIAADNGSGAWGDVSLEQGCDGAAVVKSLDGSNVSAGFEHDILLGAPKGAVVERQQDKEGVLAGTMGSWLGPGNKEAIAYEQKVIGQGNVYIVGGSGTKVVNSRNKRLVVEFF